MDNKLYNFTFIGRSGCGKGTQAELLKKLFEAQSGAGSVLYKNTGTYLRELTKHTEFLAARFLEEKILKQGEKAPDFLSLWALSNELIHGVTEANHIIIDGSPRTTLEAEVLDEMFDFFDRANVFHVWLNAGAEWVRERMLSRGRSDDNPDNIKRRLAYYETRVAPIVDFYRKDAKHNLLEINGEQSIEKVHEDIVKASGL